MKPRRRVVIYAIRRTGTQRELLVFDQRDHPAAGTQVPAAGIEASEQPEAAATRELREEIGLATASVSLVGRAEEIHPNGTVCDNWYYVTTVDPHETEWDHRVTAGEGDAGLAFHCYFLPLREAERVVHASQRTFLSELSAP